MKKSTFDGRPELLEQEGAVMRINFDVESVMEPIPSMDGGDQGEREVSPSSQDEALSRYSASGEVPR